MAEKTQQAYPSAPENHGYQRSDAESFLSADELKRKKRIKLAIYVAIFVVFQIIVITVISLTVMKVKTPKVRLGNINVQELNSVVATPSFDTKFTTQIKVKNPNWGPYKFDASTVTFMYQGAAVGQVVIPKSKAGMLSTKKMNVEVSLSSSALNSSNLGSELSSGVLTLNSAAKVTGKVELMLIMKKKKSSTMNCTIAFDLSSKTLKTLQCKQWRSYIGARRCDRPSARRKTSPGASPKPLWLGRNLENMVFFLFMLLRCSPASAHGFCF